MSGVFTEEVVKIFTITEIGIKKIEQQDANFNPYLYHDNDQYYKTLVKFKEIITNREKRRKNIYLRKQSSKQLRRCLRL